MDDLKKIHIRHNFSLKYFNTFGIDVKCDFFVEIALESQIPELLKYINKTKVNYLIIGGGSNLLFTSDFHGLIVKISLSGISIKEHDNDVYVTAGAGVLWNDLVEFCVNNNLSGIENLINIPGNAGSAPIQNIGAYGVELKDTFYMLGAVSIRSGEFREFMYDECLFGYRDSIFKNELKGKYIIISITLKLSKTFNPQISYGQIADELRKNGVEPSLQSVANIVKAIRANKLPDYKVIGNAGSFFKNPVIDEDKLNNMLNKHPEMPHYKFNNKYKLSAAWLIEKCGWKGYSNNNVGVHEFQPLVLVNYNNATGKEIFELSKQIAKSIEDKFNIVLEAEVNIV